MRTETIVRELYSFEELSDDAKQKAIEKLYDINVDYDWWIYTYDDAKQIGLKITGFDLDRNLHATGDLYEDMTKVIALILQHHGETCDTYQLAKKYLQAIRDLKAKYPKWDDDDPCNNTDNDDPYDYENDLDDLEQGFLKDLLAEYASILQKECDFLQSEKPIIETIKANEYEFTKDGDLA